MWEFLWFTFSVGGKKQEEHALLALRSQSRDENASLREQIRKGWVKSKAHSEHPMPKGSAINR